MLKGKTVLLGVTGGIAAYKAAALASALVKQHAAVEVVMTENATQFVTPLTFEQLTGRRTMVNTFDRNFSHQVEHIALAERTDLVIVAPATANVCAKLAHGLADDMLTTTILACRCPKLIAPAMNTNMYENPVTQDNLALLRRYGWEVIEPASGRLACGAVGKGKLPEPEEILQYILRQLAFPHDLAGKKVLVTAGPTQEAIDPVRYLTNHSTGKMGCAIARMAMLRGADVTLVSGPTAIAPPPFVTVVPVVSAQDMFEAVAANAREAARQGIVQDILLEVNIGEEASKSGFAAEDILPLMEKIGEFSNICIKGLMAIPPISHISGENQKFFQKMFHLSVDIRQKKYDNVKVDCLSMGMSGDFADAIASGSTMVRVGTAIFGARDYARDSSK